MNTADAVLSTVQGGYGIVLIVVAMTHLGRKRPSEATEAQSPPKMRSTPRKTLWLFLLTGILFVISAAIRVLPIT